MALELYIQTIDTKWKPASRLAKTTSSGDVDLESYLDSFAKYMANIVKEEIVKAINSQRYASKWAPLSIPYVKGKKKKNLSPKVWEATSLLKDSIKAYRYRNSWVVGIPKDRRYPGTRVRVYQVAKFMEYGTTRMPPRPLFRPIYRYLQKNIRRYWEKFLREEGVIL